MAHKEIPDEVLYCTFLFYYIDIVLKLKKMYSVDYWQFFNFTLSLENLVENL